MHGRTVREAGKELGVGAIVMVRMARSGTQLRATASLVNAANDDLLWSEAFEASEQDQFALQDQLVSAIARALNLSLSPATTTAVRARGTRRTSSRTPRSVPPSRTPKPRSRSTRPTPTRGPRWPTRGATRPMTSCRRRPRVRKYGALPNVRWRSTPPLPTRTRRWPYGG